MRGTVRWKGQLSEISKIYSQYEESLHKAQGEYSENLKRHAEEIKKIHDEYLHKYIYDFSSDFGNQIKRMEIRRNVEAFFGTLRIPFVAIDGSCDQRESVGFMSFYGGAYGSKGILSLESSEGKLSYQRWEFSRDVSMVAFVPVPPDSTVRTIEEVESEGSDGPVFITDAEIREIPSLHTKIMLLAEIYLAYSLARGGSAESPRIILVDNSLSGILGNSSFRPDAVRLVHGDFDGESLSLFDLQVALAHPLSKELGIPSTKKFQPHFRIIAEAAWKGARKISSNDCTPRRTGLTEKERTQWKTFFEKGANFLQNKVEAGTYNKDTSEFTFSEDPRASWNKTLRVFERICSGLFRTKTPEGLTYPIKDRPGVREYFGPRDLAFLIGVGIRALIEACWQSKILLIGVAKDSNSRFFYRNYVGSNLVLEGVRPLRHLMIPLTDRSILEMIPHINLEMGAPWSTLDFDSCFMTMHPDPVKGTTEWKVRGYPLMSQGEITRPERIFTRSIAQFLCTKDRHLTSHAIFLDRLVYPNLDDADSKEFIIDSTEFGEMHPLRYETPPRMQEMSMFLMTVLVRNHFPEALGYPDPLHKADWGAKSMRRRVATLLESSEWAHRAHPLMKTFREIRSMVR